MTVAEQMEMKISDPEKRMLLERDGRKVLPVGDDIYDAAGKRGEGVDKDHTLAYAVLDHIGGIPEKIINDLRNRRLLPRIANISRGIHLLSDVVLLDSHEGKKIRSEYGEISGDNISWMISDEDKSVEFIYEETGIRITRDGYRKAVAEIQSQQKGGRKVQPTSKYSNLGTQESEWNADSNDERLAGIIPRTTYHIGKVIRKGEKREPPSPFKTYDREKLGRKLLESFITWNSSEDGVSEHAQNIAYQVKSGFLNGNEGYEECTAEMYVRSEVTFESPSLKDRFVLMVRDEMAKEGLFPSYRRIGCYINDYIWKNASTIFPYTTSFKF